MELSKRMQTIFTLFQNLETYSGTNEKRILIRKFLTTEDLIIDFEYCIEVLNGQHKLGYKLFNGQRMENFSLKDEQLSLRDFCRPLFQLEDKSENSLQYINKQFKESLWFLEPLFNREWRLGIGKSLLEEQVWAPMLAKKFDPDKIPSSSFYYLTEKLDGNRCIAMFNYETEKWEFKSRSGKDLKVSFDMSLLPKECIFDGEILSKEQILHPSQENFNTLSGLINSKEGNKEGLIYTIFDVMLPQTAYVTRRAFLVSLKFESKDVRILPVLAIESSKEQLIRDIPELLHDITSKGGEGLMLNIGDAFYEHKRTDSLLKIKEVFTMDMEVLSLEGGTGKNEGVVGALYCRAADYKTGKVYNCKVGSGLSDVQRTMWAYQPETIIGQIVEIAYFSVSQDKNTRGTNNWSLRFPRLKRVRYDKSETSVD